MTIGLNVKSCESTVELPDNEEVAEEMPRTGKQKFRTAKAESWAKVGHSLFPIERSVPSLPSAQYKAVFADNSYEFRLIEVDSDNDELAWPETGKGKLLKHQIDVFFQDDVQEKFKKVGISPKRGFFLHGPQGTGKTSLCDLAINYIRVKHGAVVIHGHDSDLSTIGNAISIIREIDPERWIVLLFEDVDNLTKDHPSHMSTFLNILDGASKIGNIVTFATTNYPERLEPRIINRPGRFDYILEIGHLTEDQRREYLKFLREQSRNTDVYLSEDVENRIAMHPNNLTYADLKEMFISIALLGSEPETVFQRLEDMQKNQISSDDYTSNKKGPGFL